MKSPELSNLTKILS